MAKDRIVPCKFYICAGECEKGKEAHQNGLCQKCGKYIPRKGGKKITKELRHKYKMKKMSL